ncbi:hypothetical protein P9E34_04120 [Schinkia azotoformans]|uniref:hypothetical protein n=1 Tax=Schinkia azotoformans TaxID=1454 RepID=UPI002DB63A69|nr:hypothetical protein [Schinkia azotoformans]MEC1723932.1 hypothetical protein [Schinkia azotoformans]
MYRPTVRMDDVYRDYLEKLADVTILDRNQLFRLALFIAAHSEDFKQVISEYKKEDVTRLPVPSWEVWEDGYWINQTYKSNKADVTSKSIEPERIPLKSVGGVFSFSL